MGSSSSKISRTATGAAARKYPSRVPPVARPRQSTVDATAEASSSPASSQPSGPTVHPQTQARTTKDEAIDLDAHDPHFAASLRSLGAVQPSPTLSPSSTFSPSQHGNQSSSAGPPQQPSVFPDPSKNKAIRLLQARQRIAEDAQREFAEVGRSDRGGRQFLDVVMIKQILMLRDEKGVADDEIEHRLGLKKGVVRRLGRRGLVADANT